MPPHPRAVCGETSGGAGDGGGVVPPHGSGRRRGGDTRGAVQVEDQAKASWRTRAGAMEGGLQTVSDAGGSSG
jgi:hypothetical protein